jgi:predicted  nucleic acid-binding Zn-ribbon protein
MPTIILSEFVPDEDITDEYSEPGKVIDPDELAKHNEEYEKELDMLKLENERLKKEIISRVAKIVELEKELSDVQREKERFENSYYAYIDKVDKIRAGLENNTPARAILEWMENGDGG